MPLDVALMIEGQDGIGWPRWRRLVQPAEVLDPSGLYQSDHFTTSTKPAEPNRSLLPCGAAFAWS